MKKISMLIFVFAIFAGVQMLVPSKSEAGVSCNYDVFGNYVCKDTSLYNSLSNPYGTNSSKTTKDALGNYNTTFSNSYGGTTGTMSCRYDVFGNYVCN